MRAGEIQNLNCQRMEMATYFFLTRVRFARECKAVALQQYHEQC